MAVSADIRQPGPEIADDLDYEYLTPEELLECYRQGNEMAFELLINALGTRLYTFICRYVADANLADDVYQDTLVKLALNAHLYDGRARMLTWLYRIARNCAVDALRARTRRREVRTVATGGESAGGDDRVFSGGSPEEAISKELPPLEQLTVDELGKRIAAAVERLPDEQREVFLLREEGDLTFEEIGQVLGCGKDTAKSRMRYALQRLREALGAEARLYGLLAGL